AIVEESPGWTTGGAAVAPGRRGGHAACPRGRKQLLHQGVCLPGGGRAPRGDVMSARRVLSVGQCAADHGSLSRTLERYFGATVEGAGSVAEALDRARLEPFGLILVNRVLDADGSSGLEVVRRLKGADGVPAVPVMLVSNYEDAQREAVAAGA